MNNIQSISQDISLSTAMSSYSDDRSLIIEKKSSQGASDQGSPEAQKLMTWVSNKLTDMKLDITGISQRFDGANNAVNSCTDGALTNSLESTYSSTVRISPQDLEEVSSDEEVAIEVEYVPKS